MAKKKSDQTEKSAQEQELERRVDAMMSVEKPAATASPEAVAEEPADEPATAPQLPAKLLKSLGVSKSKAKKSPKPEESNVDSADPPPERVLKLHIDDDATLPEATDTVEPVETAEPLPDGDPLEDTETDKAVDDITAQEADLQLAVDDARARRRNEEFEDDNQKGLFATVFSSFWTWLIILGIAGVAWAWYR